MLSRDHMQQITFMGLGKIDKQVTHQPQCCLLKIAVSLVEYIVNHHLEVEPFESIKGSCTEAGMCGQVFLFERQHFRVFCPFRFTEGDLLCTFFQTIPYILFVHPIHSYPLTVVADI